MNSITISSPFFTTWFQLLHGPWLWGPCALRLVCRLPEGVSEVDAPPFQLLRVVRSHVGKLSEDIEVRGVSWGSKQTHKNMANMSGFVTAALVFNTQNIFSGGAQTGWMGGWKRTDAPWRPPLSTGHNCAFVLSVAMVTTESTSMTKSSWSLLCLTNKKEEWTFVLMTVTWQNVPPQHLWRCVNFRNLLLYLFVR